MKSKYLDLILALALIAVVGSGFATVWTPRSVPGGALSVAMSADGRVILTVPSTSHPSISTNWGQTWASVTNSPPWGDARQRGVAVSADGTTMIAALSSNSPSQTWAFITTNYGGTWTRTSVLSSNLFELVVACSGDATKMIAGVQNGPICFSTNSGGNWNTSSVPNADWASIASSADGQRMAAVVNGGKVYFSTDFGATWAPTNLPVSSWNSVCLSSDGNWVGVTSANGTYISSNAGASWATNTLNGSAIACSANGSNWIIGATLGVNPPVYTSSNGGAAWVTNLLVGEIDTEWYDAAVSADGCEFLATGAGNLWVGRTTPSPQMNIQWTNGNAAFSWLVPSTNFVLQQNSDIGTINWETISNSPILNLTNLHDEVTVPASASNSFFRLIAQ